MPPPIKAPSSLSQSSMQLALWNTIKLYNSYSLPFELHLWLTVLVLAVLCLISSAISFFVFLLALFSFLLPFLLPSWLVPIHWPSLLLFFLFHWFSWLPQALAGPFLLFIFYITFYSSLFSLDLSQPTFAQSPLVLHLQCNLNWFIILWCFSFYCCHPWCMGLPCFFGHWQQWQ